MRKYRDILEVEQANRLLGHHFFDKDTLRFFRSRISETLYGGRYFVTSEQDTGFGSLGAAWGGERRYTVRRAEEDGSISTVSEFGEYGSSSGAHARARRESEKEAAHV